MLAVSHGALVTVFDVGAVCIGHINFQKLHRFSFPMGLAQQAKSNPLKIDFDSGPTVLTLYSVLHSHSVALVLTGVVTAAVTSTPTAWACGVVGSDVASGSLRAPTPQPSDRGSAPEAVSVH
jgi:hypothetical protein